MSTSPSGRSLFSDLVVSAPDPVRNSLALSASAAVHVVVIALLVLVPVIGPELLRTPAGRVPQEIPASKAGAPSPNHGAAPPAPSSPAAAASPGLDWSAANRWLHVDTVTRAGVPGFEGARQRWLSALRRDGLSLPDGRALFWSGDRGAVRTYLTFTPFGPLTDLEARGKRIAETEAQVGKATVADYDTGDAGIVAPHYSQIWRRLLDDDFVSPVAGELTELTAAEGRIQFQQLNLAVAARVNANWHEVRTALLKQRYPLTCRVFSARYGVGQTIRLWLAPDGVALRGAPALADALRQALGDEQGRALAAEYAQLWTTQEEFDVVRRADLSHLTQ